MNKVLLTGATGFVGSALAAGFLAREIAVVALSRNDPGGARTRRAVMEAAGGFGLNIAAIIERRLQVVEVDFADLGGSVPAGALEGVTHAWHCAAEMSYASAKLASSFEANVGHSTRLFKLLGTAVPGFRRFHYVSTAYVAGMRGGRVEERLHAQPRLINPYQVTKWAAEQALHLMHLESGVPLTVFRPSVVVGHRDSGWTLRNGFGLYMFIDALRNYAEAGNEHIMVDMKAGIRPDLVSIDQVVGDAVALTLRGGERDAFEVFHCAGGLGISTHAIMQCFAEAVGIGIDFGRAATPEELKFRRATELNMPFANTEWQFVRAGMDRVLGRGGPPEVLGVGDLARVTRWHLGLPDQHSIAA